MHGYVSINGVITDANAARISVFDRIYLHGDGVIEVMAGYAGRLLACEAHVARLYRSAALIQLNLPWTPENLCAELQAMAARLPTGRSYLRLAVSAGLGLGMARPSSEVQKTIICLQLPATATNPDGYALQSTRRNGHALLAAKTPNYIESIVAVTAARTNGYDDVLWLNSAAEIAEASTANIFFISTADEKTICHTPHPQVGLLEGITAQHAVATLNSNNIEIIRRAIHITELPNFDAAFLSSSVQGIRPVRRIDAVNYATDSPVLYKLMQLLVDEQTQFPRPQA